MSMSTQQTALITDALRPGDDGYDAAAQSFFGSGSPALVVRPRGPDEVAAALDYATRHGLAVSVRSGGHSPLGPAATTGAMVIDLVHWDGVEVLDSERRLVRVGGGATWGRVATALDPYGWAITAGDTANVGVGGLTLGGGFGWMVRRDGLAIDSLVGARVVTADGRLLTVSENEHPAMFWAVRGGGGNFGVVVDFDFVARVDSAANIYLVILSVIGALGVSGWLWTVRSVKTGKRPTRAVVTTLFVLGTSVELTGLLIKDTSGDTGLPHLLGWVGLAPCLPELLAVVLLWRRA